jgi:pimeloyl-ACP methyl ester carboxylesterase
VKKHKDPDAFASLVFATWRGIAVFELAPIPNETGDRPIVGHPGEVAAMSSAESWDGYLAIFPPGTRWENQTRARIALELPLYSPIRHAHRIRARTLVIAGRNDSVTPASAARQAARRIPQARFELLDSNHFQPYVGEVFEKNIALQLAFVKDVLSVGR